MVLYPTGKQEAGVQAFGKMISHQVPIRYANLLGDETVKEKGFLAKKVALLNTFSVYDKMAHFRSKLEFNVMTEPLSFPRAKIPGELYRFLSLMGDNERQRLKYVVLL